MGNQKSLRSGLLLTAIFTLLTSLAQAQFSVRSFGQYGDDEAQTALAVAARTDISTNSYVIASFTSTTVLRTSTIPVIVTNTSPFTNFFVSRFTNLLNPSFASLPIWAIAPTIDGPVTDVHVASYAPQTFCFVGGTFSGTNISFGSLSETNTTPGSFSDVFLGKISTTGVPQALMRFGGDAADTCADVTLDASGNVYVAGTFYSSNFVAGSFSVTRQNPSGPDCFFLKCNSSGVVQWLKSGSYAIAKKMAYDFLGSSFYLMGVSTGPSSFNGTTPTGASSQFVTKYDTSGNVIWSRGDITTGSQIAVDSVHNIMIAGTFTGTLSFGSTGLTNSDPSTVFLAQYDANGNFQWTHAIPGLGHDEVTDVLGDGFKNTWLTGSLAADDHGARVNPKTFITCVKTNGDFIGQAIDTGTGISSGTGLQLIHGAMSLVGNFSTNFTFGSVNLTNNGNPDFYLLRFFPVAPAIATVRTNNSLVQSWPTPTSLGYLSSDVFTLQTSDDFVNWTTSTNTLTLVSGRYVTTNAIGTGTRFYRLKK